MFDKFLVRTYLPSGYLRTIVKVIGVEDYIHYNAQHSITYDGCTETGGDILEFQVDRVDAEDVVTRLKNVHPEADPFLQVIPTITSLSFTSFKDIE